MTRVHNFSAGPGALPWSVLEQAREALRELPGAGASVVEISHRSELFMGILAEAEANLRALLAIGPDYRVLFLQGGAQQQFALLPMNFLAGTGRTARYVLSGYWSRKAFAEATLEGDATPLWDGAAGQDRRMPTGAELQLDPTLDHDTAYLHVTSNETVEGLQLQQLQQLPARPAVPLLCDVSSEILSRPLPIDRFALLYASAQKNLGPAGLTVAIVHQELLERVPPNLHPMLDYRALAAAGSLLNTPPVFAVYVAMLVTRWLRDEVGGLAAMQRRNQEKARLVYDVIDRSGGFYRGHAQPASRSVMNATWRLADAELERRFVDGAAAAGAIELRGHRSVGGIRASMYNAVPLAACQHLASFMEEFARRHG